MLVSCAPGPSPGVEGNRAQGGGDGKQDSGKVKTRELRARYQRALADRHQRQRGGQMVLSGGTGVAQQQLADNARPALLKPCYRQSVRKIECGRGAVTSRISVPDLIAYCLARKCATQDRQSVTASQHGGVPC